MVLILNSHVLFSMVSHTQSRVARRMTHNHGSNSAAPRGINRGKTGVIREPVAGSLKTRGVCGRSRIAWNVNTARAGHVAGTVDARLDGA